MQDSGQLSIAQRTDLLDHALAARLSRRGWRLEFYSETVAVIIRGRAIDHLLDGIFVAITLIWLFVWLYEMGFGAKRRELIYVDQYGTVHVKRLQ